MAICPDHGHYTGTSCNKCVAIANSIQASDPKIVPKIEDADKYLLRSCENECLSAQVEMQALQAKFQSAQNALNRAGAAVFEKLGLSPQEWILDIKSMTFVKRATNENSSGNK